MSKSRIKSTGPILKTRDDMEDCVGHIRRLTIQLKTLEAARNERVKLIDDEYQDAFAESQAELASRVESAKAWAEANPAAFGPAKSIEFVHGRVGWRIGMPALKTIKGWTWDRVLVYLQSIPALAAFVRNTPAVDKQQILICRDNLLPADLKNMGVQIVQDETFFIDPHLTEAPACESLA